MAGTLKPGVRRLLSADNAGDASLRLAEVFGSGEVRFPSAESKFDMEFGLTSFGMTHFLFWRLKAGAHAIIPLGCCLVCMALDGRIACDTADGSLILDGPAAAILPPHADARFRWLETGTLAGVLLRDQDFRQGAMTISSGMSKIHLSSQRQFDTAVPPGGAFVELVDFLLSDRRERLSEKISKPIQDLVDQLVIYNLLRVLEEGFAANGPVETRMLAPRHIKQVEEYIRSHLSEVLDGETLAQIADVSSRTLYRGFLHFRGVSPARYIQDLRLDAVHKLLMADKDSRDIGEIAASTGFKSYPSFWRSYVRKFGVAPSKNRRGRHIFSSK